MTNTAIDSEKKPSHEKTTTNMSQMKNNLVSLIENTSGFSKVTDIAQEETSDEGSSKQVIYNDLAFRIDETGYRAQQFKANHLTISVIKAVFELPQIKKAEKQKLLSAINSFNETKPGLKAFIPRNVPNQKLIAFQVEIICPDSQLTKEMIHPALSLLNGSGSLFLNHLKSVGINLNSTLRK